MECLAFAFIVPVLAVILDSTIGDPQSFPHPVRYIGKGLDLFETSARKVGLDLRTAGWVAVILFAVGAWSIVGYLIAIPYLGFIIAIYFGYAGLALGSLFKESRIVSNRLDSGDLEGARNALAMLVSRDTSQLDANGIRQGLAETVSENLNDGFVAPLFYLTIFGPGGLWAYKTISTMDSMWGYKTKEYKDLGYAAAKMDDMLAFIPARITAYILLHVGKKRDLPYEQAKENFISDAIKMESPNAGWPMAAAAWLFEGQMGGSTTYFGEIKNKPILGPKGKTWDSQMIRSLIYTCKSAGNHAAWIMIPTLGWLQVIF